MSSRAAKPFPADIAELIRKTAEATPFTALAGIRVEAIEHGMVTVRLPFREAISRSFGIVHGGALMTLMDVAGGLASATAQETWEPGQTNVTIASSAQFLSVASGVDLIAVGRCTKAGKSIKFCEVEVTANGEPVARGAFTFKTTQMRRQLRPTSLRAAGGARQPWTTRRTASTTSWVENGFASFVFGIRPRNSATRGEPVPPVMNTILRSSPA